MKSFFFSSASFRAPFFGFCRRTASEGQLYVAVPERLAPVRKFALLPKHKHSMAGNPRGIAFSRTSNQHQGILSTLPTPFATLNRVPFLGRLVEGTTTQMSDALALNDVDKRRVGRRASRNILPQAWMGWLLPIAILVLWQLGSSTGVLSSTILPNPLDIGRAAYRLTANGELLTNMETSTLRALAGLVVGGGIGLAFGVANGLSRWAETFTDSTLQMVRNVPHLALIPLVIVWFGIDEGAKLFLVGLGVFFPIYLNTLHGIRAVDPQLVEMGRSYGMGPATLFRRIIWPGALPSIFVGLRYALGITWLTLIVAETIAAQSGIGYMAMQAREFMQTDVIVLAILIYAVLGKGADSIVRVLERVFLSWNPAFANKGARA